MELNTPIKILVFCISSFQSSWYFVFCIPRGSKHSPSEIGVAGLTMFGACKSLSFCQRWNHFPFPSVKGFERQQLVVCSFWNYCLFISRYGFISRGYHSLINFWKGPPMMWSIQLTAKLVSSSSIKKKKDAAESFTTKCRRWNSCSNTIMQDTQAYRLTSCEIKQIKVVANNCLRYLTQLNKWLAKTRKGMRNTSCDAQRQQSWKDRFKDPEWSGLSPT
jgi:hypothetical protein